MSTSLQSSDFAVTSRGHAEIRRGLLAALPVMIGFVPFALVLGAQAAQKGFSAVEVPLLTGLNFGGGSEFAAVALWTSPPHILLLVTISILVNSRHLLMGAVLAPFLRHLPRRKVLPALFFMCDESWAMGLADAQKRSRAGLSPAFSLRYYMGTSIGLYLTWVLCTALGALLGPMLGDLEAYGFHMAFPAVFLVLLRGMWKGVRAARPWLVSLVVAALTYLFVPGAWYVAAGALSGMVAAYFLAGARMIHASTLLVIVLMAASTYLTRILGYLALRNRVLSPRAITVMEAAPGCVLISVIAPHFVSTQPADLIALAVTLLASTRLSMLPTVLLGVATAGILRLILG